MLGLELRTFLVRGRDLERLREVELGLLLGLMSEVGLAVGMAGPKKSVAELVSLLIGALEETGASACTGVGTVAVEFENVCARSCC